VGWASCPLWSSFTEGGSAAKPVAVRYRTFLSGAGSLAAAGGNKPRHGQIIARFDRYRRLQGFFAVEARAGFAGQGRPPHWQHAGGRACLTASEARAPPLPLYNATRATALPFIAWIRANSRVTRSSSKTWSGPVGAMSVKGGS